MLPKARNEGLLFEEVDDELIVYDPSRSEAHCLNRVSALVWKNCDGYRDVGDLAVRLHGDLPITASEEEVQGIVVLALERLEAAHLLECSSIEDARVPDSISRRAALKKIGMASVLSVGLPVVASIIVPTPAAARSPGGCSDEQLNTCYGRCQSAYCTENEEGGVDCAEPDFTNCLDLCDAGCI